MAHEIYLQVEELMKRYKDVIAVDKISFSVNRGEVFGLLGPNGAGKTTTIRMLSGLLSADNGNVTINGIPISKGYNSVKHLIGLCPQEIVIWEQLTCMEQLRFMGTSYGLAMKEANQNAVNLLTQLGLFDKKDKLAKTLSGGMQRRLNIALALVHNPQLIILDEPQAGLDPQSRVLVRDFIRQLKNDKTVILTTHDMEEADRLSDRVAIIDHGKICTIGTPNQLKEMSGAREFIQINAGSLKKEVVEQLLLALSAVFTERIYSDAFIILGGYEVDKQIPLVKQVFADFNLEITDMMIRKPTLEDAFIALTGRGLRE